MNDETSNFIARIKSGVNEISSLEHIPEWLIKNTRDPLDPEGKAWSFHEHEYQLDILRDTVGHLSAQKCSQVGASELFVRMMLAMMGISKALTVIYTLPTAGAAGKFAKQRVDPIIAQSKVLRGLLNKEVDSSELKQIGNSFLYMLGSFGQKSAISVPAQALFKDEVDFSDQTVLTTYNSRLGHAKNGGITREFSTPTVSAYGINKAFMEGSQHYYTVKCCHCFDWVAPDFMSDVVVPGFDGDMHSIQKEDLSDPRVDVAGSFIRCPNCSNPIDWQDMMNPQTRLWIPTYSDRVKHSYQISPFDVPAVNPIARTVAHLGDYERKMDWVNFKVGQTYEDAENSFIGKIITDNTSGNGPLVPPGCDMEAVVKITSNTCIGVDVGKTSWIVIGQPQANGGLKVLHKERIRQDSDGYLKKRIMFLSECFGCAKGVIDAGPDFTTVQALVSESNHGQWWSCEYTRKYPGNTLSNIQLKEEEQIVKAFRTGTFDELVKRSNSGFITHCNSPEHATYVDHMTNMKRVETKNNEGDTAVTWIKTADDHYCHATNYMNIAYNMMLIKKDSGVAPCLPGALKVRIRDGLEKQGMGDEVASFFRSRK